MTEHTDARDIEQLAGWLEARADTMDPEDPATPLNAERARDRARTLRMLPALVTRLAADKAELDQAWIDAEAKIENLKSDKAALLHLVRGLRAERDRFEERIIGYEATARSDYAKQCDLEAQLSAARARAEVLKERVTSEVATLENLSFDLNDGAVGDVAARLRLAITEGTD